jgi:hypothetical protein
MTRVQFLTDNEVFFLFTTVPISNLGPTQPSIQCVSGSLSLEVNWPGYEAKHSPPSSAKVENVWNYTSTHPYVFMAWCLLNQGICLHSLVLNHRDNITLCLLQYIILIWARNFVTLASDWIQLAFCVVQSFATRMRKRSAFHTVIRK